MTDIEKKDFSVGSMVSWGSSGGTAQGKIVRIMRNGTIKVPKTSFSIQGTKEDPAVLIRIYRDGKPTETLVGHKMSTLRSSSMKKSYDEMGGQTWEGLNERQTDQAESLCYIVEEYGQFDQSSNANGSHYGDGSKNPFKSDNLMCSNCIFYEQNACHLVSGNIDPEGICKLWIIPESALTKEMYSDSKDMIKFWGGRFTL